MHRTTPANPAIFVLVSRIIVYSVRLHHEPYDRQTDRQDRLHEAPICPSQDNQPLGQQFGYRQFIFSRVQRHRDGWIQGSFWFWPQIFALPVSAL